MYLHTNPSSINEYTNHNGYPQFCKSDNTRKTRVSGYQEH
jgi:hypothetical protein